MQSCLTHQQRGLANVTHLIIDEVHERDVTIDFLLRFVKKMLLEDDKAQMKIILMSATLDVKVFSAYFGDCEVIKMTGRTYEVDELYLGDVLLLTNYVQNEMPDIAPAIKNAKSLEMAYGEMSEHRNNDLLMLYLIKHIHTSTPLDQGILVFVAGIHNMETLKLVIEEKMPMANYRLVLLHSEIERASADVFDTLGGMRKIVISTNIGETSITIKDMVDIQ